MGTGVGEAMLISAVTGAGASAVTGGDPLKGALMGAALGGVGSAAGGALGGQAATAAQAGGQAAAQAGTQAVTQAGMQTALNPYQLGMMDSAITAATPNALTSMSAVPAGIPTNVAAQNFVPQTGFTDIFKSAPGGPGMGQRLGNFIVQNPQQAAMISGGLGGMMVPPKALDEDEKYSGPLSRFRYDPDRYRRSFAEGGIMDLPATRRLMQGGHLGSYSDGGRLLKGPGDGMSDHIPAKIGDKQPARLADGEFVIPADVVSGLGNGSTDAGARRLYAMMDKVRQARTGKKSQGKEINANKYMPA
jgi:hypothetical protein